MKAARCVGRNKNRSQTKFKPNLARDREGFVWPYVSLRHRFSANTAFEQPNDAFIPSSFSLLPSATPTNPVPFTMPTNKTPLQPPPMELATITGYHSPVSYAITRADVDSVKKGGPITPRAVDFDLCKLLLSAYEHVGMQFAKSVALLPSTAWTTWTNGNCKSTNHGCTDHPRASKCIVVPIQVAHGHWAVLFIVDLADALDERMDEAGFVPKTAFVYFDPLANRKQGREVEKKGRALASYLLRPLFHSSEALASAPWHVAQVSRSDDASGAK